MEEKVTSKMLRIYDGNDYKGLLRCGVKEITPKVNRTCQSLVTEQGGTIFNWKDEGSTNVQGRSGQFMFDSHVIWIFKMACSCPTLRSMKQFFSDYHCENLAVLVDGKLAKF